MSRTTVRGLALVLALAATMSTVAARSGDVSATMVASEVLVAEGTADATFTIQVTNSGGSAVSNVRVVFSDGAEVAIGDVDAQATASSDSQRRVFDTSAVPSRNFPVEVTVKYSQDGADVETAATLLLRIS
jgi:protein-disulfide isomerase